MIHFPFKIPITIHPTFWLFAGLIGYWISHSWIGILIWIGIITISVLFHELGHALTASCFGQHPRIELVALGGVTHYKPVNGKILSSWKQFFIVLNGPLAGFALFALATFALQVPTFSQGTFGPILQLIRNVNLFWTIVNLLPVIPLDGGQLLRILLEKIFGIKGMKYALIIGIAFALVVTLFAVLFQEFLIGALFFLFGFQSYDTLRKLRHLSETDREDGLRTLLARAEELIQLGKREEAVTLCNEIRQKAKQGMIFDLTTQYLAFLKYEAGQVRESYELLCSIKEALEADPLCLLQKVAFEVKDFPLVIELSKACFENWPTTETALLNAYAHAQLSQPIPAVGWLQTAVEEGTINLSSILSDSLFDPIRQDPTFQTFLSQHP